MSRRVPAQEVFKAWEKDPAFRAEYDSLEDEFTLATALIKARDAARMTQEQVARAMGTSQEAIARLESGKSLPSTRTLQRFAQATGMRLRISFEPQPDTSR
jgi:DNA-binding XRE family transcriptional regulator